MIKIPKQIILIIAPWCFVWLLAIGCSRQAPESDRVKRGSGSAEKLTSLAPQKAIAVGMEERYRSLVEGDQSNPAALRSDLVKFYESWGRRDGAAAAKHAFTQNRSLIQHAFAGWLATDPDAPRDWVLSQTGSARARANLGRDLLHALPKFEHRLRAEWAGNFAADQYGSSILSEVAIAWGSDQPEETLEWIAGLPAGEARAGALETIFQRWTLRDPELASTHLTRMAEGPAKDLAISALAKAIYRDDPEAAALWAETITDEELRERTNGLLSRLTTSSAPRPTL